MTRAIAHRGPDDEQFHIEPGVALGHRRLSIVDVKHGRQPMVNETGEIWVACEGELYDFPEIRARLISRGHQLKTNCDSEAWVHLYEESGEEVFGKARGQFGVSLWDRSKRVLLLARDRIGIAPLFYAIVDGWLLWGSEIKAILASGLIEAQPDHRGLDYFFNVFAMSNHRTCFRGVHCLPPGHYLKVHGERFELRQYWDLDFPDRGQERMFQSTDDAVVEYEGLLRNSIRRRLCGEHPVCCYISGGLDSTTILSLASQENGSPLPSFTIGLDGSGPYDSVHWRGSHPRGQFAHTVAMTSVHFECLPRALIRSAEGPVLVFQRLHARLAQRSVRGERDHVDRRGNERSGYVWFKTHKISQAVGRPLSTIIRQMIFAGGAGGGRSKLAWGALGGIRTAQQLSYEMMAQSRNYLYSSDMWDSIDDYSPFDEINPGNDRMRRWHPLNQSLYVAHKVMLPGMLLAAKGDRSVKNASVEGRYPFLDEQIIEFCAQIDPQLKLRGRNDKYLLRCVAQRSLPPQIANRRKTMFRANLSKSFIGADQPEWVDQLLSPESLAATGYFKPEAVQRARMLQLNGRRSSLKRFVLDMGLTGVVATQLWHLLRWGWRISELGVCPDQRARCARPVNGFAAVIERKTNAISVWLDRERFCADIQLVSDKFCNLAFKSR
jgi:asparagine synthase (glutamine-hydrolysing)